MDSKHVILTVALVLAAALGGFLLGKHLAERTPAPVVIERSHGREQEREEEQSPNLSQENRPPEVVYRWRTETVRDTVCVETPEDVAIEFERSPAITTQEAVAVRRPIFGDPSVSFRYYDPRAEQVTERVYRVAPHPFKYGLEAEAHTQGVGIGGYTGWGSFEAFAKGTYDFEREAFGYQIGVRARLGR